MHPIVLATGNPGKIREYKALLSKLAIEVLSQEIFHVPDVEETGQSFVENAILKARHAAKYIGLPAIADDSGLVVDALQGAPGIYSARYAGAHASDRDNIEKLLAHLHQVPDSKRSARFHCVIAYLRHAEDPLPLLCQGTWEGRIARIPRGAGGFGYDPVFFVTSEGKTAAELAPAVKNRLSHRGQALAQLLKSNFQSRVY
jgi:XTP/dITP diphosphohydrolase